MTIPDNLGQGSLPWLWIRQVELLGLCTSAMSGCAASILSKASGGSSRVSQIPSAITPEWLAISKRLGTLSLSLSLSLAAFLFVHDMCERFYHDVTFLARVIQELIENLHRRFYP